MHPVGFRIAAVRLYEYFGSLRKVAKALTSTNALAGNKCSNGVSVASIWRWCQRLIPKARNVESYSRKVTSAMITTTRSILEKAPCTTQNDLRIALSKIFGFDLSLHVVRTILKLGNFSRKRTRVRGHSVRKQERTDEFLTKIVPKLMMASEVVAVDETGFDPRPRRTYGYALKGQRAIVSPHKIAKCPSRSWTVIMAIAMTGKHCGVLHKERVGSASFEAFIQSLPFPRGTCILLDNASIHATKTVQKVAREKGFDLCFTPPYSPEMNPIELVFGSIKQHFYRERMRWEGDYEDCVNDALSLVTPVLIKKCFGHVQRNFWVKSP